MTAKASVSVEADRLLRGERREDYAHPSVDLVRTAKLWSAIIGVEVDPRLVPLCMVAVKISRQCHRHKRDNLVDIAGWAQVADIFAETTNPNEATRAMPVLPGAVPEHPV